MTPGYALCMALFLLGLYGVVAKRHLLKIAFGILLMTGAAALFIVLLGVSEGHVGSLWQALGLMVILGGLAIATVMIVTSVRLHQRCGSFDLDQIWKLRG